MVILAISLVMKSITYKHQIYGFRIFRQSLRISLKQEICDTIIFIALKTSNKFSVALFLSFFGLIISSEQIMSDKILANAYNPHTKPLSPQSFIFIPLAALRLCALVFLCET